MSGGYLFIILPAMLAALLVWAGIEDARVRTIANWKNAVIALLAIPWWAANGLGWSAIGLQIGVALAVFALFCGAFYLGQMGGGDVKLIGALALWFPAQVLLWLLIVMSLAGGALTLVMLIDNWRRGDKAQIEIPYGVAIAIAGLLAVREPLFNQFT